jgi:predicted ArsR family transcriptional regulator
MSQLRIDFPLPRARRTDPDTSHDAADSMAGEKGGAATQRRDILNYLSVSGEATGDHLDEALGWRSATANRRLKELVQQGHLVRTDIKALTRSGRKAYCYRLLR